MALKKPPEEEEESNKKHQQNDVHIFFVSRKRDEPKRNPSTPFAIQTKIILPISTL